MFRIYKQWMNQRVLLIIKDRIISCKEMMAYSLQSQLVWRDMSYEDYIKENNIPLEKFNKVAKEKQDFFQSEYLQYYNRQSELLMLQDEIKNI